MDRRDENDRSLLEARVLANHRGELEAVELGHADVDQHDRHFRLEQMLSASRPEAALIRFSFRSFRITS